ncbi:MAG: protein kinase [Alphaproteobacteria bacterium]|nr:protein kinase [Alphaproteobacteria bacterium]
MWPNARSIGRYRIDRLLATGGMALTYRACRDGIGGFTKYVVLKALHPDYHGDEKVYRRFLDEARLCARLNHSNISQVFEVDEHEGVPYMVLEYIPGPDLNRLLRRIEGGPRPYGHLARALIGVCRGLDYAHDAKGDDGEPLNLVHRDISLENVLISLEGKAKVIDFGIARWDQRNEVTNVGVVRGKEMFLPPEQSMGELDRRADIYQVGVCLYWLSTGQPPFPRDDPMQLWQDRNEGRFLPPSVLVEGYPEALERVVLKAMALNPEDRYATAGELASDLEGFCLSAPEHHSDDEQVAAWLATLFTESEVLDFKGSATPSAPGSAVITTTTSNLTQPRDRTQWLIVGLLAALVLLLCMGLQPWGLLQDTEVASATPDARLSALLTQAGERIAEGQLAKAEALLERADALGAGAPEQETQRAELHADLDYAKRMAEARVARLSGDDASARRLALTLLTERPGDPEAAALFAALGEAPGELAPARTPETDAAPPPSAAPQAAQREDKRPASTATPSASKAPPTASTAPPTAPTEPSEAPASEEPAASAPALAEPEPEAPPPDAPEPEPTPEADGLAELVEPEPVAVVEAAPPAPAPPPPSAAGPPPSQLPALVRVQSLPEVQAMLAAVEADAKRRGAPDTLAGGATSRVYTHMSNQFPPPDLYVIKPAAMSDVIVQGWQSGLRRAEIAGQVGRVE